LGSDVCICWFKSSKMDCIIVAYFDRLFRSKVLNDI
jgi:hypothetical protein